MAARTSRAPYGKANYESVVAVVSHFSGKRRASDKQRLFGRAWSLSREASKLPELERGRVLEWLRAAGYDEAGLQSVVVVQFSNVEAAKWLSDGRRPDVPRARKAVTACESDGLLIKVMDGFKGHSSVYALPLLSQCLDYGQEEIRGINHGKTYPEKEGYEKAPNAPNEGYELDQIGGMSGECDLGKQCYIQYISSDNSGAEPPGSSPLVNKSSTKSPCQSRNLNAASLSGSAGPSAACPLCGAADVEILAEGTIRCYACATEFRRA